MLKIGITGQAGFVGTHLYNTIGLKENVERVYFEDTYFQDQQQLQSFVRQCDVIVHLAAMNRHNDPDVLYQTNILLVQKLIDAMENEGVILSLLHFLTSLRIMSNLKLMLTAT
jgi:UDP-2-acetamido-2,6-beta-L-arabino-hexul-4-ose reductase